MAKKIRGYKVCWRDSSVYETKMHCRTLSAKQHRNAREAAETVLMQNPGALVRVVGPRGGGRGQVYRYHGKRNRIVVRIRGPI